MISLKLTASYIDSIAPNTSAITNAKGLVRQGSFSNMMIAADGPLIFGECAGSGKNPYFCSMDFLDMASPVPRCNCPSRQIPCKHVLGLLYAYADGQKFEAGEVPQDIADKRAKKAKREESKKENSKKESKKDTDGAPPSKAKINAAIKRIGVQLDGIDIAQRLLSNIIQTGLAGIDARGLSALSAQVVGLGNYHIKGIQAAFNDLLINIANYPVAVERLIYLQALLKKAREHSEAKREDAENVTVLDITSEIEEQIGHIWKLDELREYGCFVDDADIVQLSFNIVDNPAKKEFVDTGHFVCLQNGRIYVAKNYRPYRSVKHISRADSIFEQITAETLYIYPGGMNPRIRYENHTMSAMPPGAYAVIKGFASDDYAQAAKSVKNQIKSPLADKNPAMLLKISRAILAEDGEGQRHMLIEDAKGCRQQLCGPTADTLGLFDTNLLAEQALLVVYENNRETGLLLAQPLSVITDDRIIRLEF